MNTTPDSIELIRLGTGAQYLSVIVLGRHTPGVLPLHDMLRAEIVIETGIGTLRLKTTIAPSDIDAWESAIDALAEDEPVSWLGNRCPEIQIGPGDGSGFWHATVSDPAQSGAIVQIPITIDVDESRARLTAVQQAYPREVVSTSPGSYEWRPTRQDGTPQ
ncbi:hypothetical protein KDL01_18165 [Actinospica durhamensis]|uniref:Uncharacterized protein n=1 Tax=Actinospica durhamensis TaxID=1508375 RepID=A0A941EWG8_9ACTN|nr:DUF5959 family protein [Actinospica durhamensis]MBR7835204.1 hypothetical protein [Actinospica durhamensis]